MLGDFYDESVPQLNLFDELGPKLSSEALMKVLDEINNKDLICGARHPKELADETKHTFASLYHEAFRATNSIR